MLLYDLDQGGLLHPAHPHVCHGLGKYVLPAALNEAKLTEDPVIPQKSGRRVLVVTVDLVQAYRAFEQEVELVVGIPRGEDDVPGFEAPLDYPDTRVHEILDVETPGGRGGRETPGVGPEHLPRSPHSSKPKNRLVTSTAMG